MAVNPWHAPPVGYYLMPAGQPAGVFDQIHLHDDYDAVYLVTALDGPGSYLPPVLNRAGRMFRGRVCTPAGKLRSSHHTGSTPASLIRLDLKDY